LVQKGKVLENREILRHKVWERRERGVGGTCNKKPHTRFDIPHILIVVLVLGFFSTKHGILL